MRQLTANVSVDTERRGSNHGLVTTSDGLVLIDGPHKPSDALRLGIRVIYQELNLVSHLSVAENVFLGAAPTQFPGFIDWRQLSASTARLLADLGMEIDADTPLYRLSLAQRQMVEIAKALRHLSTHASPDADSYSLKAGDASILVMER